MIHFHCLECGMKFQVKDEFAGRTTRCPTCKSLLQVPEVTVAYVPPAQVEGSESSLDRAGLKSNITLASLDGHEAPISGLVDEGKNRVGRYVLDQEIARGGMGAVMRGIDRDIRREVAIKFMLDDRDVRKRTRF